MPNLLTTPCGGAGARGRGGERASSFFAEATVGRGAGERRSGGANACSFSSEFVSVSWHARRHGATCLRAGGNAALLASFLRVLGPDVIASSIYLKLVTIEWTIRCHPSTSTNRRILNGSDTVTGGSIIIPIDSKVLDTTMSMMMNGINRTKLI